MAPVLLRHARRCRAHAAGQHALGGVLNSQNLTGRLHSEALGCMLSVGRELKRGIPVYLDSARQDIGFLKGW